MAACCFTLKIGKCMCIMGVFHGDLDRSAGVQVASSATTSKRRRNDLNDNDYDAAERSSGSPGIDDQEDLLHLNNKRLSPVDCIHWTSAAQLSLLEDEMRRVERVNVALMLSGMGSSVDVFRMATSRWEKKQAKILAKAKVRMMKQKGSDQTESYWSNLWGKPRDYQNTVVAEEEAKERAQRAAAASRRWREYSRRGADKPPTFKLPESVSNNEK